jgi:hypothetical protein
MTGIVLALSRLGAWVVSLVALRWGYKVALVAAVLSVYVAVWAAIAGVATALYALIPAHPFPPFVLQFFPDRNAVGVALAAHYGTAATLQALHYWRSVTDSMARVGA